MKRLSKRSRLKLRTQKLNSLILIALSTLTHGCGPRGEVGENGGYSESLAGAAIEVPTPATLWFEEVIASLPLSFEKKQAAYEHLDLNPKSPIPASLLFDPEMPTVLPGLPLSFEAKSAFDSKTLSFSALAPVNPERAQGVILHLNPSTFPSKPSLSDDCWHISPSPRKAIGYRWTGEADLFRQLETLYSLYPETDNLPIFLYAPTPFSEEGFRLAGCFRAQFSALIFSGRQNRLSLQNLEQFPLIYLEGDNSDIGLFEGEGIIKAAKNRGNPLCASAKTFSQAVTFAKDYSRKKTALLPPYTYTDDRFSAPLPFLKVISRNNYQDPVTLSARFENGLFHITSFNVAAIEIDKTHFPDGKLETVVWNETTFSLPDQSHVILGESPPQNTLTKSFHPSGFASFFREEPLYIVYQDRGAKPAYLTKALATAKRLSRFDLRGLPDTDLNYPMVPLSEYRSSSLPRHRAIFIGSQAAIEGFIPRWTLQELNRKNSDAYGLIYPPEGLPKTDLALFLVAKDTAGLSRLDETFLSSTALFSKSDLQAYQKLDGAYAFAFEKTFDSYFGESKLPNLPLSLPSITALRWEAAGRSLLKSYSGADAIGLKKPLGKKTAPLNFVSYESLAKSLSSAPLAVIKIQTPAAYHTLSRLIKTSPSLSFEGLERFLESGTRNLSREALDSEMTLLVDTPFLNSLNRAQLHALNPEPFPFTLDELVWTQLRENPETFTRLLLEEEDSENEWIAEEALDERDENLY